MSALVVAGCGSTPSGTSSGSGRVVQVVAAENFWASIAGQIGGTHAKVTSLITNPDTDPHDYEPTAADARTVATADYVIVNGIGYDPWADDLLGADSGKRTVLRVGDLVGVKDGGNPHRWYNPADVQRVAAQMAVDLAKADPDDAAYFAAQRQRFATVGLRDYDQLVSDIKTRYAGTPVGASESIFSMLAPALGLMLITPPDFLKAISEGTDVSAGDKTTIDDQIKNHDIKVYVYNGQNATPDIQAQLKEAKAVGIPTATITETLTPAGDSYQQWQVAQLRGIEAALAKATGR